jgi:hypothetical protein
MTDEYKLILASDILERDGLGLELHDPAGARVAEVFRDDTSGKIVFNSFKELNIPLPVLECFIARAKRELAVE